MMEHKKENNLRVAAIVPAYNEEHRIGAVLDALRQCSKLDDIVVVSDGSTDRTYEVAASYPGVTAIRLPRNLGKGAALVAGVKCASADIVAFFDADLIGLTPNLAEALLQPVLEGRADMSIGIFKGGRWRTDWAQSLAPFISGQRAIYSKHVLSVPGLEQARFGAEIALGRYASQKGLVTVFVPLPGMTHPMKEEKLGRIHGTWARLKMYGEIIKFVISTSRSAVRIRQALGRVDDGL